jgi:hypothetical protein
MIFITDVVAGIGAVMSGLIGHITLTVVSAFQGLFLVLDESDAVTGLSDLGYAVVLGIGIALTMGAIYLVLKQFRLRSKR